ncbi:MAG: hypothetical protein WC461_00230 [Candidatus Paceibacterota bacterium]
MEAVKTFFANLSLYASHISSETGLLANANPNGKEVAKPDETTKDSSPDPATVFGALFFIEIDIF